MNLQTLPGHAFCSSWNDLLPVFLSGQASYGDISSALSGSVIQPLSCSRVLASEVFLDRFFDFGVDLAACTTRGFSKATFKRSMCWSDGRRLCAIRANTVQSSPPENKMAIRTFCESFNAGGIGTLRILDFRDSLRCVSSSLTDAVSAFRTCVSEEILLLNTPMIGDYLSSVI